MAAQDVQAVLKRALLDDTFRLFLMRDFDRAISETGVQLTAQEAAELRKVDWSQYGQPALAGGNTWVHIYS